MNRLIVSPRAEDDLHEIRQYLLDNRSRDVARNVLQSIQKGMEHIASYPSACMPRPDLSGDGYSVWCHPVGAYVVYYLNEDPPKVTRVLYGARDPKFLYP